jgi:hypothetical protein
MLSFVRFYECISVRIGNELHYTNIRDIMWTNRRGGRNATTIE